MKDNRAIPWEQWIERSVYELLRRMAALDGKTATFGQTAEPDAAAPDHVADAGKMAPEPPGAVERPLPSMDLGYGTMAEHHGGDQFIVRWSSKSVVINAEEIANLARYAGLPDAAALERRVAALRLALTDIALCSSAGTAVRRAAEGAIDRDGLAAEAAR